MGFLSVCRAVYDYTPQAEGELAINEGDLLFILENSGDDGWWKAKKKASGEEDDEPTGLIPNNYVEDATPVSLAQALYEYTRQTDEELSFPEDATLQVYDTSDPDWILVGLDGEFGFAPSNYIELSNARPVAAPAAPSPPSLPIRIPAPNAAPEPEPEPTHAAIPVVPVSLAVANPAAVAIASAIQARQLPEAPRTVATPPPQLPTRSEPPPAPVEPQSPPFPNRPSPLRESFRDPPPMSPVSPSPLSPISITDDSPPPSNRQSRVHKVQGGYHLYNINEMVSVIGKRKKMPTTLGINLLTGIIMIAPERASDGPTQEWTADKMTHYSREGKHIFLELVRPSKSVDFHAGAKDTAEEIVSALGEMAGAVKANGLREVIMAASSKSQKLGLVLYDFVAQGDDEVDVMEGDEVIIMDDQKSADWWNVRRIKNGKEGVVPSSYIEITGTMTPPESRSGLMAGQSTAAQNRAEEIRLTKEAVKTAKRVDEQQVGPGMILPKRQSSLFAGDSGSNNLTQQRSSRAPENAPRSSSQEQNKKAKPDPSRVRTWTDRSKSFTVDAQFIGIKDGKLNLHKMNGVKIAVPIIKMSVEDLEYVERMTGLNLVPAAARAAAKSARQAAKSGPSGAVIQKSRPEYDWFQFFLDCDIAVRLCERYSQAFVKDSMDESVLPDVTSAVLRNLGLREGDIIKVMRTLDAKYNRTSKAETAGDGDPNDTGGLFTTAGGALRTKRNRPAPTNAASDKVDLDAFNGEGGATSPGLGGKSPNGGFDDDAWDVRKSDPATEKKPEPVAAPAAEKKPEPAPAATAATAATLTGSMQELSLLSAPLEPTKASTQEPLTVASTAPVVTQPTGASPSFFANLQTQPTSARTRPLVPAATGIVGSLVPPPPGRPLSAPGVTGFPPPVAPVMSHVTGLVQGQVAPPGQSLNDIHSARLQQQFMQQMQQQQQMMHAQMKPMTVFPTGMQGSPFVQPAMTGMQMPLQTGFNTIQPQMTAMQPHQTAFGTPSPFLSLPPQQGPFMTARPGFLPAPLEPERTGFQPQATGQQSALGIQAPASPLMPQPTGPAPPVRFGVTPGQKLAPQPTGRKANLSHATPDNPFGF